MENGPGGQIIIFEAAGKLGRIQCNIRHKKEKQALRWKKRQKHGKTVQDTSHGWRDSGQALATATDII